MTSIRSFRLLAASENRGQVKIGVRSDIRTRTRPQHVLFHVTSRGNRRNPIYWDEIDRRTWLDVLALMCERHHYVIHSSCQMINHFHLLIETVEAHLSQACGN